ncbi:MAG: hypothetical protein MUF70_17565 [Myxococcota bacterium]|jgi:hypothetical protein|nr:hypothetical protein [Myxococcota bacterium]
MPEEQASGRPRLYCSADCQRIAKIRLQVLGRQLERVEEAASHVRLWGSRSALCIGGDAAKSLDRYAAEARAIERRIGELAAADDSESEGD